MTPFVHWRAISMDRSSTCSESTTTSGKSKSWREIQLSQLGDLALASGSYAATVVTLLRPPGPLDPNGSPETGVRRHVGGVHICVVWDTCVVSTCDRWGRLFLEID